MNFHRWLPVAAFVVLVGACLAIGLWLRATFAPEWMALDTTQHPPSLHPWPVEADCYSQLARDQRILAGQGLIQNHFTVENWPEGLIPSTTAPFDYVILLLWGPLALVTQRPLDWAGTLVSPALWVAPYLLLDLLPFAGIRTRWTRPTPHRLNRPARIYLGHRLRPATPSIAHPRPHGHGPHRRVRALANRA